MPNTKPTSEQVTFLAAGTGENPVKQAYSYLKTLPEFLNATDC